MVTYVVKIFTLSFNRILRYLWQYTIDKDAVFKGK